MGSPTDWCGRVYPFHEAWAREIADRTGSGRLVSIAAGHEIYLEELDRVVEELQALIEEARSSAPHLRDRGRLRLEGDAAVAGLRVEHGRQIGAGA